MVEFANSPIQDLYDICDTMHERWDKDMRAGKLLLALMGHVPNYDPRVTRIRNILEQYPMKEGDEIVVETVGAGCSTFERGIISEMSKTMAKVDDLGMVFQDNGNGVWRYQGDFGFTFYIHPKDHPAALKFFEEEEAQEE